MEFKDRVPQAGKEGRVQITPEEGGTPFYAKVEMADDPIEPGTPVTKLLLEQMMSLCMPIGAIVLWSGTVNNIPAGWRLCNGSNGTPDLRNRFVIGAGNSYGVGANGGATSVTLSTANMPAHTHTFSGSIGSSGAHTHSVTIRNSLTGGMAGIGGGNGSSGSATIPSAGAHTHSLPSLSSVGSGSSFSILNPYYALCYIMRINSDN